MLMLIILWWSSLPSSSRWFSFFSSPVCLLVYWFCKKKLCVDQSSESCCVCFPHLFMYLLFSLVRFFLQHQTANFLPPSLDSRLFSVWSFSPSTSICSPTERSLLDFHYWSSGCCQECCNFLVLSFDCVPQSIITPFLTWSIIVMKSLRTYTITYTEEFFCLAWQRYVWQFDYILVTSCLKGILLCPFTNLLVVLFYHRVIVFTVSVSFKIKLLC